VLRRREGASKLRKEEGRGKKRRSLSSGKPNHDEGKRDNHMRNVGALTQ
jgi:hypothetical protein